MDHDEQSGESIGAILSSLATTLRAVSNKLDAVAAHVDDDRNLAGRLAKLEAWAFRTGEDVSKIGNRLGLEPREDSDEDAGTPAHAEHSEAATPSRANHSDGGTRSRASRSQNGASAHASRPETAGSAGHFEPSSGRLESPTLSGRVDPAGSPIRSDPAASANRREAASDNRFAPAAQPDRLDAATAATRPDPTSSSRLEPAPSGRFDSTSSIETGPAAPTEQAGLSQPTARPERREPIPSRRQRIEAETNGHNGRLAPPTATGAEHALPTRTEFTAPVQRGEPFGPATPAEPAPLPSRTPQPVPPPYRGEPAETPASTTRAEWLDPGSLTDSSEYGRESQSSTARDYSTLSSGNGRLEPPSLTSPPRNGYDSAAPATRYESATPTTRPDAGMTTPRDDSGSLTPGAHRAGGGGGEDTSHVDKLQAMLDELKRNPHGPFGRPEPTANELPGVDPTFAIRSEG